MDKSSQDVVGNHMVMVGSIPCSIVRVVSYDDRRKTGGGFVGFGDDTMGVKPLGLESEGKNHPTSPGTSRRKDSSPA